MYDVIASLLAFFYKLIPDYGVAISLLTVAVMLLLTPLTLKGTRSMMMMQNIQPEMKKLQSQFKDDRQKLNEEVLKLYRENNINPLSGCLPLLIQIPVFFVLVGLLRGLTRTISFTSFADTFQDPNRHTIGLDGLVKKAFDPRYLDHGSKLFGSLYGKTEMKAWGMNLADSSILAMGHSIGKALPYLVLIVGVLITSVIQQRQISGRNPAQRENPQAQLMMKLGPTMITGFSIFAPGGLVIYFFVSNLFRVGQQALISHTIYKTPEAKALLERQHAEAAEKAKKSAGEPKKGFFEKMLGDAAPNIKEQRENARNAGRGKAGAANGKAASNGKSASGKANGSSSADKQPAKPPLARSGGGRATPPGSRSSASRKKKKRK
jgi:YidC/Oxa1 family membrane protein insertase